MTRKSGIAKPNCPNLDCDKPGPYDPTTQPFDEPLRHVNTPSRISGEYTPSRIAALEADARAARTSAAVSDARRQRAERECDECRALLASFDEDRLEEIITDSIDLDWTPRTAARAIVRAMKGGDT